MEQKRQFSPFIDPLQPKVVLFYIYERGKLFTNSRRGNVASEASLVGSLAARARLEKKKLAGGQCPAKKRCI